MEWPKHQMNRCHHWKGLVCSHPEIFTRGLDTHSKGLRAKGQHLLIFSFIWSQNTFSGKSLAFVTAALAGASEDLLSGISSSALCQMRLFELTSRSHTLSAFPQNTASALQRTWHFLSYYSSDDDFFFFQRQSNWQLLKKAKRQKGWHSFPQLSLFYIKKNQMQRQKQKAVDKDKNDNCLVTVTLCASLSILFFPFFSPSNADFLNLVTFECTRATSPELWNQNTNRGFGEMEPKLSSVTCVCVYGHLPSLVMC